MSVLLFVDTNIFLDFYRNGAGEGNISILDKIDKHRSIIISTNQVAMEYKRNRQKVILSSQKAFQQPNWSCLQTPAVLRQTKQSKALNVAKKNVTRLHSVLHKRWEKVLADPTHYDKVYIVAQRLFKSPSDYNLTPSHKSQDRIRRAAWRRFMLNYPPRKASDTSIGDSINWEWIIECAKNSTADIVIVSRDTDYGHKASGRLIVNDWLQQEFRERVSRKRRLLLTDKLTEAFVHAAVKVTKKELKAEEALLEVAKEDSRYVTLRNAIVHDYLMDSLTSTTIAQENAKTLASLQRVVAERRGIGRGADGVASEGGECSKEENASSDDLEGRGDAEPGTKD